MRITSEQKISAAITLLTVIIAWICIRCTDLVAVLASSPEPDPYIEMAFLDVEVEELPEIPPPPPTTVGGDQAAPALTPEDLDNPSELAPPTGISLNDNGPKAEETPKPVTTTRPSPVKTEKVEKPTKPAGPDVDNEQKKKEDQARKTANTTVLGALNKAAKDNSENKKGDDGNSGSPKGKEGSAGPSDSKSAKVGYSTSNLRGGWGWPSVPTNIVSSEVGKVVIELQLNPDGTVAKATPVSNSGLTDATVNKCIAKVKGLRFVHPANSEIGTTARLTYTFE